MTRKTIFLSYRRDDSPGYVSKLEVELEQVFGEGRVFRDANDIHGGTQWKDVIERSLQESAALILVIGPRWERIWQARKDDPVNYVALELQRARELGVPVIPVTLDGVTLSGDIELGDIAWIMENQFHDISDRQGRWGGDFARLVGLLEQIDGIGPASVDQAASKVTPADPMPAQKKSSIWPWLAGGIIVLFVLGLIGIGVDDTDVAPTATTPSPSPSRTPGGTTPVIAFDVPDITGVWRGRDGTIYNVTQSPGGVVFIDSPGYASGSGQFSRRRPRLMTVEMDGIGNGEFAVSAGDQKMMGYIVVDGRQEYDTLLRVQP